MPMKAEQLASSLERGLAPVYLIAGPEPLIVEECRDAVFAAAREQGFLERDLIEAGARYDWDRLAEAGGAPSLFASRKLIDLRLPSGKPGAAGAKALVQWVEDPDPDLLLVISCDQWDASSRKSKWAGMIERDGVRIDVWPISARDLPGWIAARMRRRGLEPDRHAVMLLAQRLEGNLLAAHQEIEKLVLLKGGGRVTEQDVLESVADSARFDAFLLIERMFAGQLAASLRVAGGLQRTGIPLQMVIGALNRELRLLENFKLATSAGEAEAGAFRKLNIWSSRQGPVKAAAQRVGFEGLDRAFRTLALMERQGKGRAFGNPWHSLDRLVCELCRA